MDFLGNQTRMNFPGNRMGDGFSWNQTGVAKKNNNNMTRLVPARIEGGRGKQGPFRDSVVWRATSEKGFFMPMARVREEGALLIFLDLVKIKKK